MQKQIEKTNYWRVELPEKKELSILGAVDKLNAQGISDKEIVKCLMHTGTLASYLNYTTKEAQK